MNTKKPETESTKDTVVSEEYLEYRKKLFEDTVLDLVEHICEELINDPEGVTVSYSVNDKNAKLYIDVEKDKVPDLLGKRNETLVAIKRLAFKVANKHDFYLVLRICDSE